MAFKLHPSWDGRLAEAEMPLSQIVRSLASELSRSAAAAEALQMVIRLDTVVQPNDDVFMRSVQGLDLLTQELAGLRSFVQVLADFVQPDYRVDPTEAAREIVLTRQKDRLLSAGAPVPEDSTDFELF